MNRFGVWIGVLVLGFWLPEMAVGAGARKTLEVRNQHYGPHEREVFDLWSPGENAPLVVYIHGGGWVSGSKEDLSGSPGLIQRYLKAGFAIASINYRFLKHAPLQTILREDIGGFIQYARLHASELRIDSNRVFAYGHSAGGSASLWLATHDDLANAADPAPLRRKSTRILAAGHMNAQVSYDFLRWYEFFGKEITDRFMKEQVWSRYHFTSFEDLLTEAGKEVRSDVDMYGNLSSDDPPILFWNSLEDDLKRDYSHFVHSPEHARRLGRRALEVGVLAEVQIQADGTLRADSHNAALRFFNHILKKRQIRP